MSTFTRAAVTVVAALAAGGVMWQAAQYNVHTGRTDWWGAFCLAGVAATGTGWAFWAATARIRRGAR